MTRSFGRGLSDRAARRGDGSAGENREKGCGMPDGAFLRRDESSVKDFFVPVEALRASGGLPPLKSGRAVFRPRPPPKARMPGGARHQEYRAFFPTLPRGHEKQRARPRKRTGSGHEAPGTAA